MSTGNQITDMTVSLGNRPDPHTPLKQNKQQTTCVRNEHKGILENIYKSWQTLRRN